MKSYFKKLERALISVDTPVDYRLINPDGKELILVLHGFAQSAEIIMQKFKEAFPEDACVLAVNGFFPMPERKSDGFEIRFAWYFYDFLTDQYFIDYKPAVTMLFNLINQLGLAQKPKRIVGYSQGGYLAPFVAEALSEVKQVVGVSSHFLKDEMRLPVAYPLDSIHGELDDVVDCLPSHKTHKILTQAGNIGAFEVLLGESHRLTPAFSESLKKILLK